MPIASWGQGGDPSTTFAYLAGAVADQIRVQAERLDDRRESELAAADEEFFARYQAGKVSDDEWLDYIRRRRAETEYDPEQSAGWRKAELEWTEKIEDDRAQTAFERTGDYGDYIGYLQAKMRRTKDSEGRLAITAQIRQLQDEQQSKAFARGEQRIVDNISLGKATNDDLLRFYREQRGNLRSGSPLRDTVASRIRQVQARIEQDRFEGGLARIDAALAGNHITPREAARQKQDLLKGSSLQNTDPQRYWAMVAEIDKLRHSPDPADLAELDFRLQSGDLSPDEYQRKMYEISDRLMDHDPQTAWQLRSQALANATQQRAQLAKDKIPYPEHLGGTGSVRVGPKGSAEFRWLSQMDGSQYQATNCTMASGAMIATAMGYRGLSGGDLRYLTGDTAGGTNLDQMMFALGKAGVDTSGMSHFTGGAFEKLKTAVGNGRPAVLMGVNANLPIAARADPSHQGRHALTIAEYDAKKDAFLVYNSAVSRGDKRSKNGYWVSADAIEQFGWGGGLSAPGQFVLTPKGTLTPGKRKAWQVIDVDTPPRRGNTPKSYVGLNNPGASGNQRAAARAKKVIKDPPTTMTELKEREQEGLRRLDAIDEMIANGIDGQPLPDELLWELDRETMTIYDEQIGLAQAAGDPTHAGTLRDRQRNYIADVKQRTGLGVEYLFNRMVSGMRQDLADIAQITDIEERNKRISKMAEQARTFASARTGGKGDLAGVDPETDAKVNGFADGLEVAADPTVPQAEKAKAIKDIVDTLGGSLPGSFTNDVGITRESNAQGDDIGWVLANASGNAEDKQRIDNGLGEPVVVNGVLTTVGYKNEPRMVPEIDQATGQPTGRTVNTITQVLDTANIPGTDGTPGDQLPVVIVQTGNGPMAVRATVSKERYGTFLVANGSGLPWDNGHVLTSEEIATLSVAERRRLIANGSLKENPWDVEVITMPDARRPDGTVIAGARWVHEPGRSMQEGWHREKLPVNSTVVGDDPASMTYVGMDTEGNAQVEYKPGDDGYEFPVGPNTDGNKVQTLINSGVLDNYRTPPDQRQYRDESGELVNDPAYDDSKTAYIPPGQRMLNEATSGRDFAILDDLRAQQRLKRAADAKAAAEVAARMANGAKGMVWGQPGQIGSPNMPSFDPGAIAGQVMDLATRFGVKTPQQKPVDRPSTNFADIAEQSRKTAAERRSAPPSVGDRAPSVPQRRPSSNIADIKEQSRQTAASRKFVPPPPPKTANRNLRESSAKAAAARAAAAKAAAAANAAKQATTPYFGNWRV
jgi:hypothetical protein